MKMDSTGIIFLSSCILFISLTTPLWVFIWVMTSIAGYAQCQKRKSKDCSQQKVEPLVNQLVRIYTIEYCQSICPMAGKSICSERNCLNSGSGPVIVIFYIANVQEKVLGCGYVTRDLSFSVVSSRQLIQLRGKNQLSPTMSMN